MTVPISRDEPQTATEAVTVLDALPEMTAPTDNPAPATRSLDGVELPTAGIWRIDPGHAEVAFIGRHFMITKVRGRFTDIEGVVHVADQPDESSVEVTIDMASVDSGDSTRDDHLRSAEMFDVASYPTAAFRSKAVRWAGRDGRVIGDLTIHGVTRSVALEAGFAGHVRDPWGNDRAVFSATTSINREDFGLTWNMMLETGGVLVSKEIAIEIEVETILQPLTGRAGPSDFDLS